MANAVLKKIRNLKLSTKFMGAFSIILLGMTILDVSYNASKETDITQKAVRDWTYLFAENVRVSLNTLMREGKMDLRFALFKSMAEELEGLKDVRVIRGPRTDELFRQINERDIIPQLRHNIDLINQEILKLQEDLGRTTDEDEKDEINERIDEFKSDIESINFDITQALKTKEVDVRERPRDELDKAVLDKATPIYAFEGDNARVLIPYTVREKGCAEQEGCHKYARTGEVLGAISLEFSIEEINREIRQNNIKMAGIWVIRFIIFLGLIAILLSYIITHNIRDMVGFFGRVSSGDLAVRAPVKGEDEIGQLAIGFNRMAASLETTKKELDQRLLEIYALYNVSKTLNASFETEQLLLQLVNDISKSMDIDRIMVMLLDKRHDELNIASYTGFSEEEVAKLQGRIEEGLYHLVASTGKSRLVEDVDLDPNVRPEDVLSTRIKSMMVVPFLRRGEVLGLICAYKDKPSNFRPTDLNLFNSVAEHLAIALENARLFEKTKKMAITDGLTGLYNKRFFIDVMGTELTRAKRCEHALSLFMMDIDNFKHYNDTNGHQAGDDLLIEMGNLLTRSVRKIDIVCRYGGEELVVILPETDKAGAKVLADKLVKAIANHPFKHREKQPLGTISVSMGVATFPADADDADGLVGKADKALYDAKHAGKNRAIMAP